VSFKPKLVGNWSKLFYGHKRKRHYSSPKLIEKGLDTSAPGGLRVRPGDSGRWSPKADDAGHSQAAGFISARMRELGRSWPINYLRRASQRPASGTEAWTSYPYP
jgi:hypothetical protein